MHQQSYKVYIQDFYDWKYWVLIMTFYQHLILSQNFLAELCQTLCQDEGELFVRQFPRKSFQWLIVRRDSHNKKFRNSTEPDWNKQTMERWGERARSGEEEQSCDVILSLLLWSSYLEWNFVSQICCSVKHWLANSPKRIIEWNFAYSASAVQYELESLKWFHDMLDVWKMKRMMMVRYGMLGWWEIWNQCYSHQ